MLPGSLVDISLHGCKIHYTFPVTVDLDSDYTLKMTIAGSANAEQMELLCHPAWVNEDSGTTTIGMSILRSPDTEMLSKFIELKKKEIKQESDGISSQIVDSECKFI